MRSLKALLPYYRPYLGRMAAGLLLTVLANVFTLATPEFLRRGVDALGRPGAARVLLLMAAGLVGAALLGGAARFGMRQILNAVSRWMEYDLRNALFRHLETLQPSFYHRTPTGDIMARATNDLAAVRMAAGPAIMYLTDTVSRAVMAIPLMVRIDWRLTALGLVPLLGMPSVMIALGRTIHRRFEAVQEHFATLTTQAHENLSGVRVVRAYRQEEAETRKFAALNLEYLRRNMRLAKTFGALFPLITFFGGFGGVLTLWFGSLLVVRGTVTLGEYIAFTTYLVLLVWPMIAFGWVINIFQRGAASMDRIQQLMDERPTITGPAEPRALPAARGGRGVEFRGVWFRYPVPRPADGEHGDRGWALQDVSFAAPAGSWVAVVGATGAGKSTLVEMVPRLADPDRGEILLDGVPLRELPLADLRKAVGFVPQETFLFSQTIGENIEVGAPDRAAAEAASRVAQLHDTVVAFPGGYETMLGERGINLSGGQKQRAALARALARRPEVVVLDDALSAVDTHTEAAILRELKRALVGVTTLVVSHRITAIRDADLIVVLERGRVVETGRHDDLFERRGRYWQLLRRQQLEESLEEEASETA
ncbi:MAG TPA: ABC transporter ATP-binding protein [Gemmatimonadales bacterium]|nr:ABC transporter ATP-binding protein [Gemmatimonadales bacterium]